MTTPTLRFQPGMAYVTPGAEEALTEAGTTLLPYLHRHVAGDWGDMDAEDAQANEDAISNGDRIFSAYTLTTGVKIWVITEAVGDDGLRSHTTGLLPDEY